MMGRKTLKEVREELEAALSGQVLAPKSEKNEIVESLNRFLNGNTESTLEAPRPIDPKEPTALIPTKPD
jgi:hypothetical protein